MTENIFGEKFRQLREVKGLSQTELGRRLGYVRNGYIHDVEKGLFVPPADKLGQLAKALGVSEELLHDIAQEARIINLGIRDSGFVSMFRDYPRLSRQDKQAIVRTYRQVTRKQDGPDHRGRE